MTRNTLLLCAGLVAATCFVRAPAAASMLHPVAPRATLCTPGTSGAADAFAAAAQWSTYNPSNPGSPPTAATKPGNFADYQASLRDAFSAAPRFFQTLLCGLDGIYITTASQSWGYRNPTDPGNLKRYIGLSAGLWTGSSATPITLDAYEKRVLDAMRWPAPSAGYSPPTYRATTYAKELTIVAALAHEYGHILWADILVTSPGNPPDSGQFGYGFLDGWWTAVANTKRWTGFEDIDDNAVDLSDSGDQSDPPDQDDPVGAEVHARPLETALRNNTWRANRILFRLLSRNRPFPSVLGAFSPNEHFVESFMIFTLMNAGVNSLPLDIPIRVSSSVAVRTRNIPVDLRAGVRPRLWYVQYLFSQRFHCLQPNPPLWPLASTPCPSSP